MRTNFLLFIFSRTFSLSFLPGTCINSKGGCEKTTAAVTSRALPSASSSLHPSIHLPRHVFFSYIYDVIVGSIIVIAGLHPFAHSFPRFAARNHLKGLPILSFLSFPPSYPYALFRKHNIIYTSKFVGVFLVIPPSLPPSPHHFPFFVRLPHPISSLLLPPSLPPSFPPSLPSLGRFRHRRSILEDILKILPRRVLGMVLRKQPNQIPL